VPCCACRAAQGDKLFGRPSAELHRLFETSYGEYERVTKGVEMALFLFKLKVVEERYQDEPRIKYSIVSVAKPCFADESRKLLDAIGRMARGEPAEPIPAPPPQPGAHAAPRASAACARARI
jgi:hypothetical protein